MCFLYIVLSKIINLKLINKLLIIMYLDKIVDNYLIILLHKYKFEINIFLIIY